MSENTYQKLNELVMQLSLEHDKDKSLDIAIEVSNEVMRIIMPNDARGISWSAKLRSGEDALDEVIPSSSFPNQKVETWFEKHPYFGGERLVLSHFRIEEVPFESKFYWLNRSATKARVAAGVMLSPHWEDSNLTKYPNYKVGIDFFLSADTNSLLVVVSNAGRLRVLELSGKLSNTQIEIMNKIDGAGGFDGVGDLEPQRTIHKKLWEALALKEVNKKFYEGISGHFQELLQHLTSQAGGKKAENDAKLFANRLLGRLLFIWFLRKKDIINNEVGYFNSRNADADEYYETCLKPLFFGTLNTAISKRSPVFGKIDKKTPYLNGGLFDPHENDWKDEHIDFPKAWFDTLYDHFEQFNFTTDESSPEYEQVAIDPEMLGRVFENLLASQLEESGDQARKAKGTFYTPREIVSFMCKESLRHYLYSALESDAWNEGVDKLLDMTDSEFQVKHSDAKRELWGKGNAARVVPKVLDAMEHLNIIDPACGSGAFPMGMLQLLLKTIERLDPAFDSYQMKLRILENNIFGVDIEPMAVEISRLRAWLSIVVDEKDTKKVKPLPNLDFKFVCANTLVPVPEEGGKSRVGEQISIVYEGDSKIEKELLRVREEYYKATEHEEKERLQSEYYYYQKSTTYFERAKLIQSWDPFNASKPAPYYDSEYMFGIRNGFDIVIGNPPYVHLEKIKKQSKELYEPLNYQSYNARGDLYALFYERGVDLLQDKGILCYITSNKWMRAEYGKSLRGFFSKNTNPIRLIDFAGHQIFDATVDTNILLISKEKNHLATEATIVKDRDNLNNLGVYIRQCSDRIEFDTDESWTILSPIEQSIKQKIETIGVPLKDWEVKINRGILTGCNEAFLINGEIRDKILSQCKNRDERERTADLIRPILRGRDIKRYSHEFAEEYLIATHNGYVNHENVRVSRINIEEYPALKAHLDLYWDKIENRADQGATPYNLRNCAYMDDFSKQKIIWKRIGSKLRFAYDENKMLGLDSTCIAVGEDIEFITAFLNTHVGNYLLKDSPKTGTGDLIVSVQALEPARIPPFIKAECEQGLIEIQNKIKNGVDYSAEERILDEIAFDAFRLDSRERQHISRIVESMFR